MSSKTERQLKELRRLMPWTWDARVEEHPPGEKAIADFEKVLSYQEQPRTRKSGSAPTKSGGAGGGPATGTPSTAAAHHGSAGRRQQAQQGGGGEPPSHTKHVEQAPAEQRPSLKRHCSGNKRASPGQPSTADKTGREGKATRLEVGPPLSTACHPVAEEGYAELTPTAQRQRQTSSPLLPTSGAAAATPANAAQTPGSGLLSSATPFTVLASCPHQAALTSGRFHPTPATALHCPQLSTDGSTAEGDAAEPLLIRRQLLQSTTKGPASCAAGEGGGKFKRPEPHGQLVKHHHHSAPAAAFMSACPVAAEQSDALQDRAPAAEMVAAEAAGIAGGGGAAVQAGAVQEAIAQQDGAAVLEPESQPESGCSMEIGDPCPADPPPLSCGAAEAAAAAALLLEVLPTELHLPTSPAPLLAELPPLSLQLGPAAVPAASGRACPTPDAPAATAGAARAQEQCVIGTAEAVEEGAAGGGGRGQELLHLELANLQTLTPCQEPLPQPRALTTLQPLAAPLAAAAPATERDGRLLLSGAPSLPEVLFAAAGATIAVASAEAPPQPLPLSRAAPVGSRRPPRHPGGRGSPGEQRTSPAARRASAPSSIPGAGSPRQGSVLGVLSLLPAAAASSGGASRTAPSLPLFQPGSGSSKLALGRSQSDGVLQSLLTALPGGALVGTAQASAAGAGGSRGGQEACPPLFKARGCPKAERMAGAVGEEGEPRADENVEMAEGELALGGASRAAAPAAHGGKGAFAVAPLDKENHCGNAEPAAAAAILPRPPRAAQAAAGPLPCKASSPREAAPPRPGARHAPALTAAATRAPAAATCAPAAAAPATAVAAAATAAILAQPTSPVLSAWKVQQLATLSQSHHARERQLLSALATGVAPMPAAPADGEGGALGSPPQAHEVQHAKRGSAASAAGVSSSHRRDARSAVAGSRPGRAAAGQGGGCGQEVVIGRALARACLLLRRQRLSKFKEPHAATCVH